MDLDIPTAIRAQLVSLTDDERRQTLAHLESLAKDPKRAGPGLHNSQHDPQLWTARLSPQMRVLVRAEEIRLRVLAIAHATSCCPI